MARPDETSEVLPESIWLAAIGKHPGWNDHLDDIGLDTPRLVSVKSNLYVTGIGGVIDSGAWEALGEGERDDGYAHSFFWRTPDGMVVGRMWSSSDGKGRKKYPMIVCSMCRGFPLAFMAGPVLDRLRKLEETCRSEETAAGVIAAVDRTRAELRDLAGFAPMVSTEPVDGEPAPTTLSEVESLGPDGRGINRVLYELERYWRAYLLPESREKTGSRSRSVDVRPRHMRVPSVSDSVGGDWSVWARFLLNRVDPLASMLLITRDDRPWVDIIAGEPGPSQLGCLQRTLASLPYTTDIEYEIDDETYSRGKTLIGRAAAGELKEYDPAHIDAPEERLASFLGRPAGRGASQGSTSGRPVMLAVVAAAVLLVIVVIVAVVMSGGGTGSTSGASDGAEDRPPRAEEAAEPAAEASRRVPPPEDRPAPAPAARDDDRADDRARANDEGAAADQDRDDDDGRADTAVVVDRATASRHSARFRSWCELAEDWYFPFISSLRSEPQGAGAGVRERVLAAVEAAEAAGLRIDPRDVVEGRYTSIGRLIESPPVSVETGAYATEANAAIEHIESLRSLISAGSWEPHRALRAVADGVAAGGGRAPGVVSRLVNALGGPEGQSSADAVMEVADAQSALESLASRYAEITALGERVRAAGAGVQARCYESLSRVPASAAGGLEGWIGSARSRADELIDLGGRLERAASEQLPRIDPELMQAALDDRGGDRCEGEASLVAWLGVLGDESLYPLDPALDPRRGLPDDRAVAALRGRVEALAREGAADAGALSDRFGVFSSVLADARALAWNQMTERAVQEASSQASAQHAALLSAVDAAERVLRVEAEAFVADLRGRDSVTATGSAVIDEMWRASRDEAIAAYERDGDVVLLTRAVERDEARAAALDRGFPPVSLDLSALGAAAADAARLLDAGREERLGSVGLDADEAAVASAADSYTEWAEGVAASVALSRDLRAVLDGWGVSDEGSLESVLSAWGATWLGERVPAAAVDGRAGVIASDVLGGDRASLVSLLGQPSTPASVLFSAWERLGEDRFGWPDTVDEFRSDGAVVERLLDEAEGLPGARREAVRGSLRSGLSERWLGLVSGVGDWAGFESAARAALEAGLDASSLSPAVGYNLFVADLRGRASGADTLSQEAVLAGAERLMAPGSGLSDAAAVSWLDGLRAILEDRGSTEVDYSAIGPARTGWEVVSYQSGRRLEYSLARPGGEVRKLGFQLVEGGPSGAFYLCETEAPAWLLYEFALAGEHAEAVLGSLQPDWDPLPDSRVGPSVWTWGRQRGGGRGVRPNSRWTVRSAGASTETYSPRLGDDPGRPSREHPIQRVSPHAAAVIAATIGCRLPTVGEWEAAYNSMGRPAASAEWNLRDSTFEIQRAFIAAIGEGRRIPWPDLGIFLPDSSSEPTGAEAVSHDWSDGRLWFDEVGAGRVREFRHLVGNVSEFVLRDASNAGMQTDRMLGLGQAIAGLDGASRRDGTFAVIGGSSLSPPGMAVDRPTPTEYGGVRSGYADVGLRPAFSLGVEKPLAVLVDEAVRAAPFLRID